MRQPFFMRVNCQLVCMNEPLLMFFEQERSEGVPTEILVMELNCVLDFRITLLRPIL